MGMHGQRGHEPCIMVWYRNARRSKTMKRKNLIDQAAQAFSAPDAIEHLRAQVEAGELTASAASSKAAAAPTKGGRYGLIWDRQGKAAIVWIPD
jgi:hypothetical protein